MELSNRKGMIGVMMHFPGIQLLQQDDAMRICLENTTDFQQAVFLKEPTDRNKNEKDEIHYGFKSSTGEDILLIDKFEVNPETNRQEAKELFVYAKVPKENVKEWCAKWNDVLKDCGTKQFLHVMPVREAKNFLNPIMENGLVKVDTFYLTEPPITMNTEKYTKYLDSIKYYCIDEGDTYRDGNGDEHPLERLIAARSMMLVNGDIVHRGDRGGLIAAPAVLSHEGSCWLKDGIMKGHCYVGDDALIMSTLEENKDKLGPEISGSAELRNNVIVCDGRVGGNAFIQGDCVVEGIVTGNASLNGSIHVEKDALVRDVTMKGKCIVPSFTNLTKQRDADMLLGNQYNQGTLKDSMQKELSYLRKHAKDMLGKDSDTLDINVRSIYRNNEFAPNAKSFEVMRYDNSFFEYLTANETKNLINSMAKELNEKDTAEKMAIFVNPKNFEEKKDKEGHLVGYIIRDGKEEILARAESYRAKDGVKSEYTSKVLEGNSKYKGWLVINGRSENGFKENMFESHINGKKKYLTMGELKKKANILNNIKARDENPELWPQVTKAGFDYLKKVSADNSVENAHAAFMATDMRRMIQEEGNRNLKGLFMSLKNTIMDVVPDTEKQSELRILNTLCNGIRNAEKRALETKKDQDMGSR